MHLLAKKSALWSTPVNVLGCSIVNYAESRAAVAPVTISSNQNYFDQFREILPQMYVEGLLWQRDANVT